MDIEYCPKCGEKLNSDSCSKCGLSFKILCEGKRWVKIYGVNKNTKH